MMKINFSALGEGRLRDKLKNLRSKGSKANCINPHHATKIKILYALQKESLENFIKD